MSKNIAIIFAGGSGQRMGSGIPKQFIEVAGKPIIIHTLELFEEHPLIDGIYIACKEDYIPKLERLVKMFMITKVKKIVSGGVTGQDSIYRVLSAAYNEEGGDNIVLIHDGVRPCVTSETIDGNIKTAKEKGSAVTCNKFFETPITSREGDIVDESLDRKRFYTAQAPQTFLLKDVIEAHRKTREKDKNYEGIIDTCTLMRSQGKEVYMVEGNRGNIKVTTPEDLYVFRGMLEYKENQQALGLSEKDILKTLQK
ncbi:MAG: 2-C-methyl-D-erythritol 4-phosphate cytidylyltransferase [Clostridiales bacterium]|nr:2-C-methyl-D-erythritol 4-phosphate cytidylyltransferase [Clostridiales bacterium]